MGSRPFSHIRFSALRVYLPILVDGGRRIKKWIRFSTQRAQIYPAAAGPLCVSPQQKQPEDLLSQPDLPGRAPGQQGLYGGQICIGLNLLSQKDILH